MLEWLKTNVIMLLAGAVVVLVISLLVSIIMYKSQKADFSQVQGKYTNLQETNKGNVKKLIDLNLEYNALVEKQRLDEQRAKDASERLAAAMIKSEAQRVQNQILRERLAQKDPAVREYLQSGMPASMACLRWPKRCTKK